jgi:hypothetical protein
MGAVKVMDEEENITRRDKPATGKKMSCTLEMVSILLHQKKEFI